MEGSTLRDDEVRTEVREGSMWAKDEVEDTDSSDTGDTGSLMPSLLDIAPPDIGAKDVDIRGTVLRVRGIAAIDWAILYARFPELRIMVGGGSEDIDRLRAMMAQSALIAAGTGKPGEADVERAAMTNLSADERQSLIEDIIRLSLPGDVFSPLLDAALPNGHDVRHGEAPSTSLPRP